MLRPARYDQPAPPPRPLSGVEFDEAWGDRQTLRLGGLDVAVMSVRHLITNKRASGRPRDLLEVSSLEAIEPPR